MKQGMGEVGVPGGRGRGGEKERLHAPYPPPSPSLSFPCHPTPKSMTHLRSVIQEDVLLTEINGCRGGNEVQRASLKDEVV